ncbi:2-oxoisovalerate dehydrogenase subunit alpha 1, mitochondrial-like [Prosopis cineraria]|uniref:2-oxoisovalerate dehydrogenase subunit alpha 1, mitochondrial-like n=1 Tax=Prosopis cineraria TaxID=364024 RepID=UPI00241024C5|nr:2-oxoisovalerate dehydrogenase subunit alpha 1, mitochondrial-like [Prosopis cineraria]
MATWLLRGSRTIIQQLPRRMAFLGAPSSLASSMPTFGGRDRAPPLLGNTCSGLLSHSGRHDSTKAQIQLYHPHVAEDDDSQLCEVIDFPGGKVAFTSEMRFTPESAEKRVPCYRVLDDDGVPMPYSKYVQVSKEMAVKMYSDMVTLQIMDNVFYEVQRQGRISFYLTSTGEEAVNIASAAALSADDVILPQYREPGVLLWRGFTLQEFANQLLGNEADFGRGRQMPIHYGSIKHNYFTISSPIATQLPQAAGVAYALKMEGKKACAVTYIGDGGSSEGDFHAALNFAAVMEAPVIFICRNNGWAISTPIEEQFRSDGVVVKGRAYGIRSIRVDGNDALAVYSAVHAAREMAVNETRPVLIEALTYRAGHHSTSDDSTKYRSTDEIEYWKMARNPVNRFKRWVESNGWWDNREELELRESVKEQLLQAIQVAEKKQKPALEELFKDVYDQAPSNLQAQERQLRKTIKNHPGDYPSDVPL